MLKIISGEEIAHYRRHLFDYKYLRKMKTKYEDRLLELTVERNGLHAVQYDKIAVEGSQDASVQAERIDDLRNKIETVENQLLDCCQKIEEIEHEVNQMDDDVKESVWLIYLLKKTTFRQEAKRKFMDTKTLRRRIDKEIIKILENKEI